MNVKSLLLSYRARLLLLVLLAVLPAFGLISYNTWEERVRAEEETKRQSQHWAALVALEQSRAIDQARQLLVSLANIPIVRDPSMLPRCQETLANIGRDLRLYANIGLVDAQGNLLCSALPTRPGLNYQHRPWFQRAMNTAQFSVGDYLIGSIAGVPVLTSSLPVLGANGKPEKVLFAAIDLIWLNELARKIALPQEVTVSIVDAKGTMLAHYPDPQHQLTGKPAPGDALLRPMLKSGCRGSMALQGGDGQMWMNTVEPMLVNNQGCVHVRIGIPMAQFLAPIEQKFQRNVQVLLLLTLLVFAIAWVGGDWLVLRRLRALTRAARRLGQGDLSARTGLARNDDEIGAMARSFDEMAEGLAERDQQLQLQTQALAQSNRALTVLSAGNRAMLHAADEAALTAEMCQIVVAQGGYAMAWIGLLGPPPDQAIVPVAEAGIGDGYVDLRQLGWGDDERGQCACGIAVRERRPVVVHPDDDDAVLVTDRDDALQTRFAACIALPLQERQEVFGTLCIYATEPDAFELGETDLLYEFASDLAFGMARLRDQARRREAEIIEDLYNQAPCGYHSVDRDGCFLRINDTELAWLGYERAELIGRPITDILSPASRETFREIFPKFLEDGRIKDVEFELLRKDGSTLQVLFSSTAARGEHGQVIASRSTVSDITERKQIQQALQAAKEAAEAAARAKSEFLANMSHEIRTPMNSIIGMSYLTLKTELSPKQANYLDNISSSAQHLLGVIDDILDFSKIEAGKLDIETTDFNICRLLEQVANLINSKATSKGLELIFDVDPELPNCLRGDPLRLKQVLINFANNAVKFTEHGEIAVRVRMLGHPDDSHVQVRFEVNDTGIGLSPPEQSRLFQSFQQADSSITRKYGGTGLGLAICKQLVQLMGGSLGVNSQLGAGSTFWFSCPLGVAENQENWQPTNPALLSRRMLVVDDNPSARVILTSMLTDMHFRADQADSGERALLMVAEADRIGDPYAMVFLDWMMPAGLDGIETSRQIAALALLQPPIQVMVTAYGREEGLLAIEGVNIASQLIKPLTRSAVYDTLISLFSAESIPTNPAALRPVTAIPHLTGAQILLVEDNAFNQEVAKELLGMAGAHVTIAQHGQAALDILSRQNFDCVLMDVQMPVMDGYEATRAIRANPAMAANLIIAMTANALLDDQKLCLEAGMDDFIAKPIDPGQLYATLVKHLHTTTTATPTPPLPEPTSVTAPALINLSALAQALGNDGALVKRFAWKFLDTTRQSLAEAAEAQQAGDVMRLAALGHRMKSAAKQVGALPFAELCQQLESSGRHADSPADTHQIVEELQQQWGEISTILQQEFLD